MSTPAPYKGLIPYTEEDAPFFFGREHERAIITANLLAARLTLLYGPSGVGKSSVLRAGVAHELNQLAQQNLAERGEPELAVIVFSSWRDDPIVGLSRAVQDTIAQTLAAMNQPMDPLSPPKEFVQNLEAWTQRTHGDLLIILDQFEEYFLYHAQEDGERTFADEFPRAVNRPDLRVNFLVSLREDALSKLDRFKGRIPNLFDNYLRIEHLSRDAARDAIEKPLDEYNRQHTSDADRVTIEPALVDAVLSQVQTGRVTVGRGGRGVVEGAENATDARIETPYLQLVMTRLWDEETAPRTSPPTPLLAGEGRTLHLATLTRLGGAQNIVRTHLDAVMAALPQNEQEIAARVFHHLVTPSGTKIAHTARDLSEYAQVEQSAIQPVLEKLSGSNLRIFRTVEPPPDQPTETRYEIFHDVLAAAILDWRARYAQTQERAAAAKALAREEQRVTRLRLGVLGLLLVLLVIIGLATFSFVEKNRSDAAERAASDALDIVAQQDRVVPYFKAVMRGHFNGVRSAIFSPDGMYVVSASDDGSARIWDARTGAYVGEMGGAGIGSVRTAAVSANGNRIVTTGPDQRAHVWDAANAQPLRGFSVADTVFNDAQFSPDGKFIVTAGGDGVARVWDTTTGDVRLTLRGHTDAINQAVFSPDSKWIATASVDHTAIIWDATTGISRSLLSGHAGIINWIAFSPDSKLLVTSGDDNSALVWTVANGGSIGLISHNGPVNRGLFSPDSKLVVTASGDKTAKVWDVVKQQVRYTLDKHKEFVTSAEFSPDGKSILTASGDNTARVWSVDSGLTTAELRGHISRVNSAHFSADGKWIVTASEDKTVRVWDISTEQQIVELRGHTDRVNGAVFSPDGTLVATASADKTMRLWNMATGAGPIVFQGHTNGINSVAFSPDGKSLVTASADGTARVWDSAKEEVKVLDAKSGALMSAQYGGGGNFIQTAGADGAVRIWDASTGLVLTTLAGHKGAVNSIASSPDGKLLASAGADAAIIFWDVSTGQRAGQSLSGHKGSVTSVAFSPDGKTLASASQDTTVMLWDVATRQSLGQLPAVSKGTVSSVAFSPDGKSLVTASSDNVARVWDVATKSVVTELSGHAGVVNSAAFSPDGKRVVTASADGTARIWKIAAR
ncbi:MAG: WD40 repeat domain-containing protein [Chloroflexota bacterium]